MTLFGRELYTDYRPLLDAMQQLVDDPSMGTRAIEAQFPDLWHMAVECMKELAVKRLDATVLTYFSFRLQAWSSNHDAEPSTARRCIPAGMAG